MTKLEEKNLKTQIELLEEIVQADDMILHLVQSESRSVLKEVIEPKMFMEEGQKTVEISAEEFTKLRLILARLSEKNFEELNSYIKESYIDPKKQNKKILSMLQ